jgi:hypothetical protein
MATKVSDLLRRQLDDVREDRDRWRAQARAHDIADIASNASSR